MCYVQRQSWQISSLMSCPGEYKRRLCPGWVSAANISQLTRWTKSSFLLLSLAAQCKFYCLFFSDIVCKINNRLTSPLRDWQWSFRLSEASVRKPKFFFVTTSSVTSTLQTAAVCYISDATLATCTGRKRRSIDLDGVDAEGAVQPSRFQIPDSGFKREDEGESEVMEKRGREGRFLLYWITTTSRSTSTSFTTTFTVSSVLCTPPGATLC